MRRTRLFVRDYIAELESLTGIERTAPRSVTPNDAARLTRKYLGPSWGKPRRERKTP